MSVRFEPEQLALAREKLSPEKLEHSLRVGELAARQGPDYATVGLLHDMLEDSDVTLNELRAAGVTDAELAAIQLLTRGEESYEDYVATVVHSRDRLAISVKICDLLDHLDPSLSAGLTVEKQAKYLGALPHVLDALRALGDQPNP
ncbi:MAG: hypothetical protein R2835_06310 [Thermomicrobiales bacterium]